MEEGGILRVFPELVLGKRSVRLAAPVAIILLLAAVSLLVYMTGGTKESYLHLVYIPVILGAAAFGAPGGVLVALAAGTLFLGPLMPLDVGSGTPQPLAGWVFRTVLMMIVGGVAGLLVGRLRDRVARMRWTLYHNPTTGLLTRAALDDRLSRYLAAQAEPRKGALLLVAVNNIETISNILGSDRANRLPASIARRLINLVPEAGEVYQIHADKLALLVTNRGRRVHQVVRDVINSLAEPVNVDGVAVFVDAVFGSAAVSIGETSPESVVRKANIALGVARSRGARHNQYARDKDDTNADRVHLLSELPRAMKHDELQLHYQPQLDLASGDVVSAEALIRWQHPTRGLLSPGAFLPWVEETGLITVLTEWVVDEALRNVGEWRRQGYPFRVAINVSARNLTDGELPAFVHDRLRRHRVDPAAVELEITESAVAQDPVTAQRVLRELKGLGVQLSLDDFGDGYTSLRHLTSLPLDRIKIDQSIVRAARGDKTKVKVIAAIIGLAHELDLPTVAEGVEDPDTEQLLSRLGCELVQGFFYSKPVPLGQLLEWRPAVRQSG